MKKEEILFAIEQLRPAFDNSGIYNYAGNIIFDGQYLLIYADKYFIRVPFKSDIRAAVSGSVFYKFIQSLNNNDDINLFLEEKKIIIKSQDRTTLKVEFINMIDDIEKDIPNVDLQNIRWRSLPEDFILAISFCEGSLSADKLGPLQNICLLKDQVIGSNNIKASRYKINLDGIIKNDDFLLIPKDVVSYLIEYEVRKIFISEGSVFYKNSKDIIFAHQIFVDNYPKFDDCFELQGLEVILPIELGEVLKRASVLGESNELLGRLNNVVEVSIFRNKILVKGSGSVGKMEESIFLNYQGGLIKFKILPDYLAKILLKMQKVIIGEKALLFKDLKCEHIICLL